MHTSFIFDFVYMPVQNKQNIYTLLLAKLYVGDEQLAQIDDNFGKIASDGFVIVTQSKLLQNKTGPLKLINRWSQKNPGFYFMIIHRLCKIVQHIDSLTQRFGHLIENHLCILCVFHDLDVAQRPNTYSSYTFATHPSKTHIEFPAPKAPAHIPHKRYLCIFYICSLSNIIAIFIQAAVTHIAKHYVSHCH